MARRLCLIPTLILLGSCGSPPKPPTVDESKKRPANAQAAVDLQVCKSELHNSRIVVSETTRLAESASATATRLALLQQTAPRMPTAPPDMSNMIYTIHFAFGSVEVKVPESVSGALIEQARSAALITLRGRTDGEVEMPAESRMARERAAAVRIWLVQAGVDPARIRTTWQPVGDHIASNGTVEGRSLNRRVEIEFYRSAPQVATLRPSTAL